MVVATVEANSGLGCGLPEACGAASLQHLHPALQCGGYHNIGSLQATALQASNGCKPARLLKPLNTSPFIPEFSRKLSNEILPVLLVSSASKAWRRFSISGSGHFFRVTTLGCWCHVPVPTHVSAEPILAILVSI